MSLTLRLLPALALTACLSDADLQAELDARDATIDELRAELDALQDRVDALDPEQASQRLIDLEAWRTDAEPRLADTESDVDALQSWQTDTVDPELGSLDNRTSSLELWRDGTASPLLASLNTQVGALETWRGETADPTLTDHGTRIDALETVATDAETALTSLTGRVGTLESDATTLEGRVDDAETEIGSLDVRVRENDTTLDALDGRIETIEDDPRPSWITTDTTWTIASSGGDYTSIAAAVEATREVRVRPDAVLTLDVADGTWTLTGTVNLDHPDGANIELVGNEADPSKVVVNAASSSSAFVVRDGHGFGRIAGFTLRSASTDGVGLQVTNGAWASADALVVEGFDACVEALLGGVLTVNSGGLTASDCDEGIRARLGGIVQAQTSDVSDTNRYGVLADFGGVGDVQGSTITDAGSSGVGAIFGATVEATSVVIDTTGDYGVTAVYASSIEASRSTVDAASESSWAAQFNSYVGSLSGTSTSPGTSHWTLNRMSSIRAEFASPSSGGVFSAGTNNFVR